MIQTQQVLNSIIKLTAITVYVDSSIASCDEKLLYMELISVVHCEIGGTKTTNFNNTLLHPSIYLEYNAGDRPFLNIAIFFSLLFSDVYLGIPFEVLGIVNNVSYLVTNSAKYTFPKFHHVDNTDGIVHVN